METQRLSVAHYVFSLKLVHVMFFRSQYKFGDIIEFGRGCPCKPAFKHYGIYVGPERVINVGQGDNDIFHRTRTYTEATIKIFIFNYRVSSNVSVKLTYL